MEREEILDVAAKLFRQKGYHATSTRDLAQALGIQKASLYYYIKSKDELLVEIVNEGADDLLHMLELLKQSHANPRERLFMAIHNHFKLLAKKHDYAFVALLERRALPEESLEDYLKKRHQYEIGIRTIMQEGMDSGWFPTGDAALITRTVLGVVNWTCQWFNPHKEKTLEEIGEELMGWIFNQLLNPSLQKESAVDLPTGVSAGQPFSCYAVKKANGEE